MSKTLVFSSLHCAFDQPTSTSSAQARAISFTYGTGILLSFESNESSEYIRTLDMALFSCFETEEEHLIYESRLRVNDIFVPSERKWLGADNMNALSLYDLLVHGNVIHNKKLFKKKNQKILTNILQKVMNDKISEISQSTYLNSLIEALTIQNQKIWLNIQQIHKLTDNKYQTLKEMFIGDNDEFGSYITYLKQNFNVAICPIFKTKWEMTKQTFDLISRVSENHDKNSRKCCGSSNNDNKLVLEGEIVKCELSKEKEIVFRPEFTKIGDIFDVKMKLVGVYNDIPIKVHFNIQWKALDNYYTSLHPRWMDIKEDNSFDITLPSIDGKLEVLNATSLEISIMLHNFEDFDVEYKDSNALNPTVMTQNMEHSNVSYTFPDCLSCFYGVSNSIISILDSISDVAFIVFMLYYTEKQEYINDNEFQYEKRVTNFLFISSIGNLISIAIIIAFYTCYQIPMNSWSQRILVFFGFFIVSPALPAIEYSWSALRNKKDVKSLMRLSLQYDGILMWFKQELHRNKIFLIECLFESCFQIIIQFIAVFALKSLIIKDIYLYSSIGISLAVIISKFVLFCYNLNRTRMILNILCYFIDIFVSLTIALFMGSILFGNVVSFTGLYFIFEYILFVSFGCYHLAQSLLVPYLAMPMAILFCYPMTIFSFSTFSMYPLCSHLIHKPMEIGKFQTFHKKLYKYCCDSQDKSQFNTKLIIANYLCIKSYFGKLRESDDKQYYEFAKWLVHCRPSDLQHITLRKFRGKANNTIYRKISTELNAIQHLSVINPSTMALVKATQLLARSIMVIPCIALDIFYLKIFSNNSNSDFIQNYGNMILMFSCIVMILFLLWPCFVLHELYISKWNIFCRNMIASTHRQFVLLTSSDDFIQKCQHILENEHQRPSILDLNSDIIEQRNKEDMKLLAAVDISRFPHYDLTQKVLNLLHRYIEHEILYLYQWISLILISIAVLVIIVNLEQDRNCFMYNDTASVCIYAAMIISIIISIMRIWKFFLSGTVSDSLSKSTIFALYSTAIGVRMFTFYFDEGHCLHQIPSILILSLLFLGSEFTTLTVIVGGIIVVILLGIMVTILSPCFACCYCRERSAAASAWDVDEVEGTLVRANTQIGHSLRSAALSERQAKKLLLLGTGNSGKSTLFKTLTIITNNENIETIATEARHTIRQNLVSATITLLQKSQQLYDEDPEQNGSCLVNMDDEIVSAIQLVVHYRTESFLNPLTMDHDEVQELGRAIYMLWSMDAIRKTFELRNEYYLPDNMDYFFDKVREVMMESYTPTQQDALKCRKPTTGIIQYKYEVKENEFVIVDVGGQRNERKKWIHHFDAVAACIFVAALDHYYAVLEEDERKNAMHEAIELFAEICNSKWFRKSEMILFLNKDDLFREKLMQQIPLNVCFSVDSGWEGKEWDGPNYKPIIGDDYADRQHYDDCYTAAIQFIQDAFISANAYPHRTVFAHVTCATSDTDVVEKVFWDVQNIVIRSNLRRGGLMV